MENIPILDLDKKIEALRERLKNFDAQQTSKLQKNGLFSDVSMPDAMSLLQGDITKLLIQVKLQDGFDLTADQLSTLKELRAEVRGKVADVSPSAVKKSWTEVRQQAELSKPTPVPAHRMFKQWAEDKREMDEEHHKNKSDGPGPSNKN